MVIKFFFTGPHISLTKRQKLKHFISGIFEKENTPLLSLTYIFCSDKYLLAINKTFLQHNDYTDVITFSLSEPGDPIEGEIYISTKRVKENSILLGVSVNKELHRVIFHGALHLCGYNDKTPKQKKHMTLAEDTYLNYYFE